MDKEHYEVMVPTLGKDYFRVSQWLDAYTPTVYSMLFLGLSRTNPLPA